MGKPRRVVTSLLVVCCWCVPQRLAAQAPRPIDYVTVTEARVAHDPAQDVPLGSKIDRRHNLRVQFKKDVLRESLLKSTRAANESIGTAKIRIRAILYRKDAQPQPIPIDNYAVAEQVTEGGKPVYKITYNDELFEVSSEGVVKDSLPDTFINLAEHSPAVGDRLMLKITDVTTQNDVDYVVDVTEFGLNARLLDTFLLLKRRGVDATEEKDGVKNINFRPAPGVLFGWVYTSRESAFARAVAPGFGYVVSFTDWNDPAFDPASGQFATGTDANKIEIATGPAFTLFDNTLQFSFGWNLNVSQDRTYYAVGFSFFKLSDKLTELIKK